MTSIEKIFAFLLLLIAIIFCSPAKADDLLWYHDGGKDVDQALLMRTIDWVLSETPCGSIPGMRDLVFETLVVETRAGSFGYTAAAENWQNYGIAQIRADTARWLLEMLFKRDRAAFSGVYQYYDPESSLEHNLLTNVPFSIALCAELYAWRLKGRPIGTLRQRAIAWKKYYNTYKGAGSVEGYVKRVQSWG